MLRVPVSLSILFVIASMAYGAAFWGMTTFDAVSAWSRFEALNGSGAVGRAVGHGDRAVLLREADGQDGRPLQQMQLALAEAHRIGGNPETAIELFAIVLDSPLGSELSDAERMDIKNKIAVLSLEVDRPIDAAVIMADFVDAAGDAAAQLVADDPNSPSATYITYVNEAMDSFTDALPPVIDVEIIKGEERERLMAADRLTTLGGYYARLPEGQYAAAGILAAAYRTRFDILGADDEDTAQTALLLAPVYQRIGRLENAEKIYLSAFHAQERAKGPNNPELSLYIRLLADVYRQQNRITEAEALNVHMRTLFRDAFGARRYAANQERNRVADINRPVSVDYPLPADYIPNDLIAASIFSIPTSKDPNIEEMKIRAAQIDDNTTMPKMLADLVGECQTEKERLSLRSGYRSYETQEILYNQTNHRGKVTRPGTSEHQTGLAVDIDVNGRLMRSTDKSYQCFEAVAWRFGFILTYPRDNDYLDADDPFEPWHWRFVGPQTALLYRETGPLGYPLEFLAALPCYEERALSGLFVNPGGEDVCLASVRPATRTAVDSAADVPAEDG